ncbi:hypothetical protein QJQ45_003497 [Haematococcus lacustris]|nr:hypothetical protein QJQ45_003497 [Haematococcus lacustris]
MQRRLAREAAPTPAQRALKELAAKRAARDVVRVGEDELEDVLDDDIDDTASLDQEESSSASDSDTGACRKPAGRLQRLDAASMLKKAVSSASDLQQLINGVSSLGIGKAVQTPQQHLPMNVLHVAATCQLPSDSDSSIDSDSSSGNEAGRGNRGDNDTTGRAASPDGSSSSSTWKPSAIATGTQGTVNRSADDLVLGEKHEYHLPAALYKKLYAHQGLGKTMQCSAFLTGLLGSRLAKRALIIAPKTLLLHWEKELGVCGLGLRTHMFGDSASERAASLRTTMGPGGGVLLTTYGMVLHNAAQLASPQSQRAPGAGEWAWDYMILDEGHKVKNPKMKLVQELHRVPAKVKVIISGTPIQNNLAEMHSLMEFCCEGLLGDVRTFKRVYEKPITSGQDRDATPRQREVGAAVAAELRRVLAPYFLRREKASVMCGKTTEASTSQPHASADSLSDNPGSNSTQTTDSTQQQRQHQQQSAAPPTLGRKNDLVVWLRMRPLQQAVYRAFLESEPVKRALNETDSPLAALSESV